MYDKTKLQSTSFHLPKDVHMKLKLLSVSKRIPLGNLLSLIVTEVVKNDSIIVREMIARKYCAENNIDPDEVCADGGVLAWMVVDKNF